MANVNRPNGFSPVNDRNGANWNSQANLYYIVSTDPNQYNIGDLVKSTAGGDANGVPAIVKDTAGTATERGVIVGFMVDPNNLNITNVPATKTHDYYAYVVDDPNTVFECTDDGNAGWSAAAAIGKNCSVTVANPTSPQMLSASVLKYSTLGTANTLNIKILGAKVSPDNSPGPYCRWLVKINLHELGTGTSGV